MKTTYFDGRSILAKTIKMLADEGAKAVEVAYRTSEFTSRTGNLADSFGSAVYYNGELLTDTIFSFNPTATIPRKWYGSVKWGNEELLEYLRGYKPKTKGLSLVLVAAMPYADILEGGKGNLRHKYKVISGANSVMRDIANKMNGFFDKRRGGRIKLSVNPIK